MSEDLKRRLEKLLENSRKREREKAGKPEPEKKVVRTRAQATRSHVTGRKLGERKQLADLDEEKRAVHEEKLAEKPVEKWTRLACRDLIVDCDPKAFRDRPFQKWKVGELRKLAAGFVVDEEEPVPETSATLSEENAAVLNEKLGIEKTEDVSDMGETAEPASEEDEEEEEEPPEKEEPERAPVTPAPSTGTASELLLFVDCVPLRAPYRLLSDILLPLMAEVAELEADADIDEPAFYARFKYNRGPAFVAAQLMKDLPTGNVVLFTSDPASAACLEVLRARAGEIVVPVRG